MPREHEKSQELAGCPYADLDRVAAAWPMLSEHIKAAILALVDTAGMAATSQEEGDRSQSGAGRRGQT